MFLASKSSGTNYFKIDFIESKKGVLTYRSDNPFASCSGKISWTESSTVLPIAADHDSKTSLLFVSKNAQGKLQTQLARSTGVTLLPESQPTVTSVSYDGNATISRATSTGAVNLLNVRDTSNGPNLDVFLFDSKSFSLISSVQQPQGVSKGSIVSWADPRGIGRVDCVMGTIDTTGKVTIKSMPCSSSNSQPVDYICGYENGLASTVTVLYAPLSDSSTYTASDQGTRCTTAAMNAMARNAASSKEIAKTRSEIVHFPYYVVKQLSVCPNLACPDVREIQQWTYTNARLEFSGRGWLGFETISRESQSIGVVETTSYFQSFPYLGQVSRTETREVSGDELCQVNEYPWDHVELNDKKNVSIRLPSLRETFYEAGNSSHAVDVSFIYDDYANLTKTFIACSQTGSIPLTIHSKYSNDLHRWVIGNKTSESVEQSGNVLKKSEYTYVPGTHIPNCTKKWIADSKWSSQVSEFDRAGNQISVKGPKSLRKDFTYDETYSHKTSIKTWTDASHALLEEAIYDLVLGKPLKVTDVNGYEILRKYDVLGRLLEVSESAASVLERRSYHFEGGQFFEKQLTSTGLGNDTWNRVISYFDGSERIWKTERSRPDDLSKSIYSFFKYDGAGRLIARARDTMDIDSPSFTTYEYDTRSRLVQEVAPPIIANGSSVTTTYLYAAGKMTETRSDGNPSKNQVTTREISYLPNPEPSADNLVKSFVTELLTPLNQPVKTTFDGLGRPTTITDPSGVQLTLAYDGLSRQTKRHLKDTARNKVVSHFTVIFDDDNCQNTVRNELTSSTITSKTDIVDRVIERETADETISFVYDDGGTYTKGKLFKASSSKGFTQQFDYDLRGHITLTQLQIDGFNYLTSSEWTSAGQLLKITNPDGTIVTRTFLPDGQSVSKIVISDGSVQASAIFSEYDNPFRRPLTCNFGNGIESNSSIASNGMLTKNTLKSAASDTVLLEQNWTIQASGQIGGYEVNKIDEFQTTTLRDNTFQYDLDGDESSCPFYAES